MKDLLNWLHAHPIKACGFTCWFTMAACLFCDGRMNPWLSNGMFVAGLVLLIAILVRDTEKDWRNE